MIHEVATIIIDPARATDFEAAVKMARPYFEEAPGFVSFALQKSIENVGRYLLIVGWETVEAHMVDFRNADGFQAWRNLVGDFFTSPPMVEHTNTVI
ncbi:antibiotic biosynthesis monooxygenase family protein [Sphingobium sp. RAC03]|uniref:antibiotic biosynthesis monooxygenase family protein n=1 Tax=Sphingobium sp. RAC03 TaxID=1843368 RepID=UPI00083DD5D5|nr:antibiotic biosynthesis monooxygenase family protein [Sphingobium sp. RAC03]AOF96518.1 antibiotic biosynthesis monooxygenase family protein [Sphingobium sp. RAC03]